MPLEAGHRIGPYEILGPIGAGAMGDVYKARDTRLDRLVAIKVSKLQFSERFAREARSIAALNHPHICTLFDVGPDYLVMEYIEGQPWKPPLPVDRAVKYAIQVADALETAHAKGIVHRDIKPSNILITSRDEAKVLDFGLARQADSVDTIGSEAGTQDMLTQPGAAVGTTPYMSPEQVRGQSVDGRADLWALGVVLYQSLAGVRPFDGPTQGMILESVLAQTPRPLREHNSRVPAALERVVSKCLQKDRSQRYQQASDLLSDLHGVQRLTRPPWLSSAGLRWAIALSAAFVLALAMRYYFSLHRAPRLTDRDTIVLADFVNQTGDPVFDGALRQGLAVQLEQSPFLSLISDQRIRRTLALMQQPPDARLTPEVAGEVCQRSGSAAVLAGSIASLGAQYVLGLRATNCRNGEVLDDEQEHVAKKEDVLNALSQIAGRFRSRAGESLAMVKTHQVPLIEATTASLDALKAYSAAQAVNVTQGGAAAVPLFQHAVELDPNFALAQAHLGLALSNLGESAASAEHLKRAYELRSRTSDPERFFISVNYERNVTGDVEKAAETGDVWARMYPRDMRAHALLSSLTQETGRLAASAEEGAKAIAIDPDFVFGYVNRAWAFVFLDRPDDAETAIRAASEHNLDSPDFPVLRFFVGFLKGDPSAMERAAASAKDQAGAEDWIAHAQALAAAYSGHLRLARELSRRAGDLAQRARDLERAATYEATAAIYESLYGYAGEARARATAALERSKGRDVEYPAAFALAVAGDVAQSQKLAGDLNNRFGGHTAVQYDYLPVLRALAALKQGQPQKAEQELQSAGRYPLNGLSFSYFYGSMYPAYIRGEAFLAGNKPEQAAAEFQKIIGQPGIMLADPVAALARLQIARAWRLAGDTPKARSAYQDFFALWKGADPDIPILKQAKAEFASIK